MTPEANAMATVCVVNYRTLDLTRLCLRSIRKFSPDSIKVIVIDNDSQDASLDYLRSLSWIQLIERKPDPPDPDGVFAHGAGLDLGLAQCDTDIFISLHSDTVILQPGWLDVLVWPFADQRIACVGTGKLELKPQWQQWLQRATDMKALLRRWFSSEANKRRYRYFNTTICSAYRADILRQEGLSFHGRGNPRLTVGRQLYYTLKERGFPTVDLPSKRLAPYIAHLAHATQALHAKAFLMQGKKERKYLRRARKVLDRPGVQAILADDTLDA